MAVFLF